MVLPLLETGKLTLAMDRTNWKFGGHAHNILVIGVVFAGYTVPLVWDVLDHGGANSTAARIALLDRLLALVPSKRIEVLLADREFVGKDWFTALAKRRPKRCIRIREDTLLDDIAVRDAFMNMTPGEVRGLLEREMVYGSPMQVVAMDLPRFCTGGVKQLELASLPRRVSSSQALSGDAVGCRRPQCTRRSPPERLLGSRRPGRPAVRA